MMRTSLDFGDFCFNKVTSPSLVIAYDLGHKTDGKIMLADVLFFFESP